MCSTCVSLRWLHAWCTDRRFQQPARPYLLHQSCLGFDSIEHYDVCAYMWSAAHKKLQISTHNVSLGRFFALEPLASDDVVLLACNVYAVLSVTNTQRAINRRCSERDLPLRLGRPIGFQALRIVA